MLININIISYLCHDPNYHVNKKAHSTFVLFDHDIRAIFFDLVGCVYFNVPNNVIGPICYRVVSQCRLVFH